MIVPATRLIHRYGPIIDHSVEAAATGTAPVKARELSDAHLFSLQRAEPAGPDSLKLTALLEGHRKKNAASQRRLGLGL